MIAVLKSREKASFHYENVSIMGQNQSARCI